MYELIQAGKNTFYIDCPAKIGVWRESETDVYLIDSGSDKDAGRKVRQILEWNHWRLKGILNTHSNADHIGGNQYLQSQTGCQIFANGAECAIIRHTGMEPSLLYGGYPFRDLHHKFLLAKPSDARYMDDPAFPKAIDVIPLPGHFLDMVGFRTPDDVVFAADCVSSEETLNKYGVTFLYDIAAQLQTLDAVAQMKAALFVPAHTAPVTDMKELTRVNRDKILEIAKLLLTLCQTPMPFDRILQAVFNHYSLTMNAMQYALVGSTIRSYLAWLKDDGRMTVQYQDNLMLWQACAPS